MVVKIFEEPLRQKVSLVMQKTEKAFYSIKIHWISETGKGQNWKSLWKF